MVNAGPVQYQVVLSGSGSEACMYMGAARKKVGLARQVRLSTICYF